MTDPHEHSVFSEPHTAPRPAPPVVGRRVAQEEILERRSRITADDVDHSVWDEPSYSALNGTKPSDGLRYESYLESNAREVTWFRSWMVVVFCALAAGPWAVLGALLNGLLNADALWGVIAIVVVGPLVEEIMKVAIPLWVVERKPYLFKSPVQIVMCAAIGGFSFAVIENYVYLNIYFPSPPEWMTLWRWTVCVALHVGCSTLAGVGLLRVWNGVWRNKRKADLSEASFMIGAAAVIHGLYNAVAVFFEFIS